MVPSSSGLGRLVLIQKIAGSTPAGITTIFYLPKGKFFVVNKKANVVCKKSWKDSQAIHKRSVVRARGLPLYSPLFKT